MLGLRDHKPVLTDRDWAHGRVRRVGERKGPPESEHRRLRALLDNALLTKATAIGLTRLSREGIHLIFAQSGLLTKEGQIVSPSLLTPTENRAISAN